MDEKNASNKPWSRVKQIGCRSFDAKWVLKHGSRHSLFRPSAPPTSTSGNNADFYRVTSSRRRCRQDSWIMPSYSVFLRFFFRDFRLKRVGFLRFWLVISELVKLRLSRWDRQICGLTGDKTNGKKEKIKTEEKQ